MEEVAIVVCLYSIRAELLAYAAQVLEGAAVTIVEETQETMKGG